MRNNSSFIASWVKFTDKCIQHLPRSLRLIVGEDVTRAPHSNLHQILVNSYVASHINVGLIQLPDLSRSGQVSAAKILYIIHVGYTNYSRTALKLIRDSDIKQFQNKKQIKLSKSAIRKSS